MINLEIYSTTGQYFSVLDKLPSYIKPLGLGDNNYPDHWLKEKNGKNISKLNKYYREVSGIYWIWKNRLNDKDTNDWIGSCGYRKLWLNNLYEKKRILSVNSLYSNLLKHNNKIFMDCDVIQVQPIFLKNETIEPLKPCCLLTLILLLFKSAPEPLDAENSSLLNGSIITAVVGTSSISEHKESAKCG